MLLTRAAGVALACAVGLGWGWVVGRVFARPSVQDVSATLVGFGLGVFATVVAEITLVAFTASSGGLGAMSAGFSETFLFGLPVAIILSVVVGRRARRRVRRPALVPVALATASALLGAAWVMATASSSFA